jgi:putative membrane protein
MQMSWIMKLLLSGLSLLLVDYLLVRVEIEGIGTALVAALILGIVNTIVRPILVFLTLPVTVVSLGLFLLVINAFTYWGTSLLVPGFNVFGFWGAFWGALVTTIITSVVQRIYSAIVRE